MSAMESYEDSNNSLPFIDDTTDEEITPADQYNLKIIENYQNKNRNIEITNQVLDEVKSLSPVAPLAEETELSDSAREDACKHTRVVSRATGVKLVIRGWNSTVSIQGLDNKSSLTFRRKTGRMEQEKVNRRKKDKPSGGFFKAPDEPKPPEKPKKGRWKKLTRSLISTRFERRGMDERYPKYVLLKNEEEVTNEEEIYPKMIVFNDKKRANKKENFQTNFKKSFNNKTKPLGEILSTKEAKAKAEAMQKKPKMERSSSESRNLTFKKKITVERRKSFGAGKTTSTGNKPEVAFNVAGCSPSQGQVFNEIRGIFEDALKLCPDPKPPEQGFDDLYTSVPPQFCQFPCHEPCCYTPNHPPMYIPVYSPYNKPTHVYKHSNTQTNEEEMNQPGQTLDNRLKQDDKELELQNLSFGILSSFFPRVVIMKTFQNDNAEEEKKINEILNVERKPDLEAPLSEHTEKMKASEDRLEDNLETPTTLEVPQRNLSLKSKTVPDNGKPEPEVTSFYPGDIYINCLTLNEISSSDEEHKTKTDDSEATEYLQFSENDVPGNESIKPTSEWESQRETTATDGPGPGAEEKAEGGEETIKNLSLTKIGYKMYDNLTKLSLKREKEVGDKPEVVSGRGCDGNGTEKSPCNITLESNNRIVKVTVPDNELNLRFGEAGVEIGVTSMEPEREAEDRKVVRKTELWHTDDGRKEMAVAKIRDEGCEPQKGFHKPPGRDGSRMRRARHLSRAIRGKGH